MRAIGPSLAEAGTADALQDPTIDLHNRQGVRLVSNDDWRSDDEEALSATGVALKDDRESAILQTLAPGSYTAFVRGAADTTETGLVEVYRLNEE